MADNKNNKKSGNTKVQPEVYNDQLGENASGEYRSEDYANVPKDTKGNKRR